MKLCVISDDENLLSACAAAVDCIPGAGQPSFMRRFDAASKPDVCLWDLTNASAVPADISNDSSIRHVIAIDPTTDLTFTERVRGIPVLLKPVTAGVLSALL